MYNFIANKDKLQFQRLWNCTCTDFHKFLITKEDVLMAISKYKKTETT